MSRSPRSAAAHCSRRTIGRPIEPPTSPFRVNDPATRRRDLHRAGTAARYLHDFNTTARIAWPR
jgi:hypothetical protein